MSGILVVDDEKELADVLCEYLKVEGFETETAYDGEEGAVLFDSFNPDLCVLDIMLPKKNGIELLKEIREKSTVPVIMLSAKNGEMDKVICLGAGADDYVTKPFSPLELVARVKAQIRRHTGYSEGAKSRDGQIKSGAIRIKKESYEAFINDELLELSTKEFELLLFLTENENHVFSKEQLYENVWGINEYGDIGTVAVHIKKLRDKLSMYNLDYIKTVWGVGYKYVTV